MEWWYENSIGSGYDKNTVYIHEKIPKKLSINTEYVMIKIKNRGNSNKHTNTRINWSLLLFTLLQTC